MLTMRIQMLVLVCLLTVTLFVLYLVFQNYEIDTSISPRVFNGFMYTKELEVNVVVFLATFVSNLRDVQLFIVSKFLGKSVKPLIMSIIRVLIKTISVCLFDYRIIHVNSTSYIVRFNILLADITSFLFDEARCLQ